MKKNKVYPTEKITEITKSFQEIISRFEDIIDSNSQSTKFKSYDSDVAIADYIKLLIKNIEGVLCLANTNPLLLPPALIISRSIFELSVKLLWLMEPNNYIERENRLIAMLDKDIEERKTYIREIINLKDNQSNIDSVKSDKQVIENIRDEIKNRLSNEYKKVKLKENFNHLLKELGLEKHYPLYKVLCSSVHAQHSSTWTLSYFEDKYWSTPLQVCWATFAVCIPRFSQIFNYESNSFLSESTTNKFNLLFKELKQSS
jgi:hypothetical protein